MFNKIYTNANPCLAFLKSSTVKTFPSGRRRSEVVDKDSSTDTKNNQYYIPFDPEARLNTEANARKHSSLNGYTQTYLKEWNEGSDVEGELKNGRVLLSLAGYLFDIDLNSLKTPANFGTGFINSVKEEYQKVIDSATASEDEKTSAETASNSLDAVTELYANIILEDVHLYSSASGLPEYYTSILRDQINAKNNDVDGRTYTPSSSLDLLNDNSSELSYITNFENYYFSGLSFSVEPLTGIEGKDSISSRTVQRGTTIKNEPIYRNQQVVSLRLLEKVGETWQIYQPAYLPRIEHGITDDSVVVYGDTTIKSSAERPTKLLVEGTAEVNGDTLLKSNLTVKGTTEVDGNTTIHSNLSVDDNINVGDLADEEKAAGDNVGNIVAKNDITAKHDLKAENDLSVNKNATIFGSATIKNGAEIQNGVTIEGDSTIKNSLVIGNRDANDELDSGELVAKARIKTPEAIIDELTVSYTGGVEEIKGTKTKINSDGIEAPFIAVERLKADGLAVGDKISITSPENEIITDIGENIHTAGTITADTSISAPELYQEINKIDYKVPVIELTESGEFWQLKISRIGTKS